MPQATMDYTAGQNGGRGGIPVDRKGTSIDAAIDRINSLTSAIHHITNRVTQVVDTTIGTAPQPQSTNKLDHPPASLQEHIGNLEAAVTELDNQVLRLF